MTEETGSAEAGNPAEASAPAAPAPAPVAAAAPAPAPWIEGVQDADLRGWAENKGLQAGTFENVLNSYHNLEKLMGQDKAGRTVQLLSDDSTPDQRADFYNKLGRPEQADAYSFKLDDGADTARLDAMRTKAHELGITDAQFSGMAQADIEYLSSVQQRNVDDNGVASRDAVAALEREWGAAFEQNVEQVDRTAKTLGISEDQLNGLRSAMTPVEAMKFIHQLGTKLGDDKMITGESVGGLLTPATARQQLGELQMNKDFTEAWLDKQHPGHKAALEKKAALSRMASGIV